MSTLSRANGMATISRGSPARQEATEPVVDAVLRKSRRMRKFARRLALNALSGGRPDTRVVFIVGAQRSGTRVPLVALESAPDILTYREGARPFFHGVRLTAEPMLDELFAQCAFPVLVLKPLCESHRARQLLERFPGSRVLWIFRNYEDTITSSSLKWSSGIEAVEQLLQDRLSRDDWRRGGVTPALLEDARRLYQPGLSLHHANAVLWYVRSRLLLDLDLFACPDALVIKYEDLTSAPVRHFPRVFQFVGQPLRPQYLSTIHSNATRRRPSPLIPRRVADACEALYAEIDRRYQAAVAKAG
jgi:hypothetical protein